MTRGRSIGMKLAIAAAILLAMIGLPFAGLLWMTAVPGTSWDRPLPPLTRTEADLAARLKVHVTAVASRPHDAGHPEALEAAARHIEAALGGLGYRVTALRFDMVRNVEAVIEPAPGTAPAETLVVGAHYDSYPGVAGANDNGSGTAAVLELARMLADLNGRSRLRIRLVLFANEEPPFFKTEKMGSLVYARRLKASAEPVMGMISLETMGFYSDRPDSQHYPPPLGLLYPKKGDFVAFVGTVSARDFVRRTIGDFRGQARFPSVGGTAPGFVPGIDRSDHWSFGQVGIPALMVTDTAPFRYPHYHIRADTPDKVDYERLARVVVGLEAMIRDWAAPAPR